MDIRVINIKYGLIECTYGRCVVLFDFVWKPISKDECFSEDDIFINRAVIAGLENEKLLEYANSSDELKEQAANWLNSNMFEVRQAEKDEWILSQSD